MKELKTFNKFYLHANQNKVILKDNINKKENNLKIFKNTYEKWLFKNKVSSN